MQQRPTYYYAHIRIEKNPEQDRNITQNEVDIATDEVVNKTDRQLLGLGLLVAKTSD